MSESPSTTPLESEAAEPRFPAGEIDASCRWPLLLLFLSGVLWLESLWLRWFDEPFGSSLLCLARKPG